MTAPLIVVATIVAAPPFLEAVEQALAAAVLAVRTESGCEQYDLHRDLADPHRLVMVERWCDEAALAAHERAPAFLALAAALEGRAALEVVKLARLA
ncbi:putative quinol monooxygenase [Frateuria defendens]|uniref:putative quinol monooxygenase n=1 Tax=Frateuria defendens TaxID=2219559 RepID=UPI00066FE3E8|nr:antibiotic biosynthesis monooxygenase [Frateuria defendens]